MADLLIQGGKLVAISTLYKADLLIRDGKIVAIGDKIRSSSVTKKLNIKNLYITPGFIDLHIHGGGGADFIEASSKALHTIFTFHSKYGTTSLLATLITAPLEKMQHSLQILSQVRLPWLLGVYLEGPFISKSKKGAFSSQHIIPPTSVALEALLAKNMHTTRIITFAPEIPGAQEVLQRALTLGVIPAIGHTSATYKEAISALNSGAKHFTHLGNAMSNLDHREPGAVGAALDSDAYVELICDGIHLHPAFVRLVAKVKGFDRICLVTDAISAAGLLDGEYSLGDLPVFVRNGIARLSDSTLAGSTLTMNRAIKNFIEFTGCSLPEAVRCATLNPARLLGIDNRKGSIEVGKDADLVIFDTDFNVHYTIVGGKIVYARQ